MSPITKAGVSTPPYKPSFTAGSSPLCVRACVCVRVCMCVFLWVCVGVCVFVCWLRVRVMQSRLLLQVRLRVWVQVRVLVWLCA